MKKLTTYFSKGELALWGSSAGLILVSFFLFDRVNFMTLAASLIGTTSLIFNAKGNPIGQALMIVFSLLYGVISYSFSYFGEMITYLGMTGPMALFAFVSWLRNPYQGNHAEVAVNRLENRELTLMYALTAVVTVGFYFILDYFNTANMIPSTLSVTTSFIAVYLTFRRSPYFALAYAANDVVLIVMWTLAAKEDISYLSVIICFVMFLVNDLYGFVSWQLHKNNPRLETCVSRTNPGSFYFILSRRFSTFSSIRRIVSRKASSRFPLGSSRPQSSRWEQGRKGHWTLQPMVMTTSTSGMSDRSLLRWVSSISMPCTCFISRTASWLIWGLVSVPAE